MNIKKNLQFFGRLLLLVLIAILIFVYSRSYERYINIKEFTEPTSLTNDKGYDITQEYPLIGLEGFDSILNKLFQRIKYNEVCFRDEGSEITEEPFKGSNLMITITYSNETKNVSYKTGRKKFDFIEEQCFTIKDKNKITWNWDFSSDNPITKGFLEVKEFEELVVTPKVSTYLKVNRVYYIVAVLLSLFYSGVFLWALTRIWKYLKEGFK